MCLGEPKDVDDIIQLAKETWQETYQTIISQEQIDFMLAKFYNENLILEQIQHPQHHFLCAKENDVLLGYSHCYHQQDFIKLSKLYINPKAQKRGIGQMLLEEINQYALKQAISTIELNVNRHNPAYYFYLKMGFQVVETVDIPLDKFWLNDYVMQKKLS